MEKSTREHLMLTLVLVAFFGYLALHAKALAVDGEQPSLVISALVFTAFGLLHAVHMLGWRRALTFFAVCSVLSWLAEEHSIYSANVGEYFYTNVLGPKLDQVPVVIPLTWFLMMYPSYVLANLAVTRRAVLLRCPLALTVWLAVLTGIVMTAWDLVLDPYMTKVIKAWVWVDFHGGYFDVPFANYWGWVTVVFGINLVYRLIERWLPFRPLGAASVWVAAMPVGIYALNTVSSLIVGEPTETRLIAAFAMGLPVLVGFTRLVQGALGHDVRGATAPPGAMAASGDEPGAAVGARS